MILFHGKKLKTSERGVALIVALLMLMLISAALMGMIMMSNTETNVSANFRDEQTAFFASKAGVEEIRDRLRTSATDTLTGSGLFSSTNVPPFPLPGQTNGILYVTNPAGGETDTPWLPLGTNYPDDEICKEVTCVSGVPVGTWYASASASTSYAATPILPWKWVRVMAKLNKPSTTSKLMAVNGSTGGDATAGYRVCWGGTNEVAVSNVTYASCAAANSNYLPVYELTALAVTSSGSRRMTQYEISRTAFPPFPGAMIFDGLGADFGTNPHSNHQHASGTDAAQGPNAGAGCGAPANQPAIGTTDGTTATNISGQLNDASQFVGGVAPVGSTLSANSAMNLTTVDGLTSLVNMITAAAGSNVYSATAPTNMGIDSAPVINVVNGDVSLGGSGAGILLVTGQLTELGGFSYNGIILVIGKGSVVKNGGGGGTMNGSLFLANMYSDPIGTYTHLIALGASPPNAPGKPSMAWNGGGNANIQYDSCWISAVTQSFPYRIVAQRELIY